MEEKDKLEFDHAADHWGGNRGTSTFGSRLAESAELAYERRQGGYTVEQQKPLPVVHKDVKLDCGYRLDLVVEGQVIVEVKAIERLAPIPDAQLLSHPRVSGESVGLIIHFPVRLLKNGHKRIVNEVPDSARSASNKAENSSDL